MFTTQSGVQDNSPAHRAGRSGRPSVPPEPASTALSLIDHTGAVESGRFSPDGRRIVSDGWDKTLRESHTADAARRTRAPSPTPRPPPAPPGTLMHVQSGTPTALTCRSPAPPRRTSAPLRPTRRPSNKWSSLPHSLCRSCNTGGTASRSVPVAPRAGASAHSEAKPHPALSQRRRLAPGPGTAKSPNPSWLGLAQEVSLKGMASA